MMCYKYVRRLYLHQLFTLHPNITAVLVFNDFFIMYFGFNICSKWAPGGPQSIRGGSDMPIFFVFENPTKIN